MKEPLQRSEEIKGELPFFMPAHLLAVGSRILGHKEDGVFMSAYTHTRAHACAPVVKSHLQLLY